MARITNFLKLWLPEANEVYNVEKDQNENFEKIDTKLKEWDTGKENTITKKAGFNLDKTNLTENNSNKLFTAKGALDLFNNLTTAISTTVEAAKTALRLEIAKKIDKTSKSDAVNSTSSETVATSLAVKTAYDKGVQGVNDAADALRVANSKQSPATTLAGYGITDNTWGNLKDKPTNFTPASHNHTKSQITDFAHTHDDRYFTETEVNAKFNAKHLEIVGKDYGGVLNTAGAKTAGKTYWDNNTKKLFLCKNNNSDTSANVNNYIALDNNSLLDRLENLISVNNAFKNIKIYSGTASNVNQTQRVNLNIAGTPIFVGLSIVNSGYRDGDKSDYAHYYNLSNTGFNIRCGSDFRETINWIVLSIV